MTIPSAVQATVVSRLWPQTSRASIVRVPALILIGSALMAIAAHIQMPFWPVKLSMQSFAAVVIGMAYGWRLGSATILAYLVEGAMGLPVFAGGAGIAYMMGPTGGYMLGFLLAAIIAGYFAERGALRRLPTALGAILLAVASIYLPGIAWLAVLFGVEKSIVFGVIPFIPAEVLKISLALALTPAIRRLIG